MFDATTSPWYLPTWVSNHNPVTSPTAHSRSPARRCASTGTPPCSSARCRPSPGRGRRRGAAARWPPGAGRPGAAAVVELQDVVLAVAARRRRSAHEDELDAVAAQDLAERLAERRRLAGEQVRGPVDQHGLPAESPHDLGHLHADRSAAEDQQTPWNRRHPGRLAVGPHPGELAQARHRGQHGRRAGRQDHVIGRVPHAVDLDHPGTGQPAAAPQQVDARCRPATSPDRRRSSRRPCKSRHAKHGLDVDLARSPRPPCRVDGLAGAQQRLGRDAGLVRALAADQLALDHRDPQPAVGQRARTVLPGRASADDDHVVVGSRRQLRPGRLRTMYARTSPASAASVLPVRVSCSPWAAAARRSAVARSLRTRTRVSRRRPRGRAGAS